MIRLFSHRLRPPAFPQPVERDSALEGLRGGCALLVFVAHLFLPARVLDPAWAPSERFAWFNLGYPAVLMFFVLSGYVIGLVTTRPATTSEVRHYLLHRAARLVPLNIIVVIVSWLLLTDVTARTVWGNLAFLQNYDPYPGLGIFPVLANNPNLWSLNYEAVYYLGFIALWIWAPPVTAVFGGLGLVICAHGFGLPVPLIFARYACGALYWVAGLAVAWLSTRPDSPPRRSNWVAAGLVIYAVWIFAPLRTLGMHWELATWLWPPPTPVSPHRLDFLPASVWLLLTITGRAAGLQRILTWTGLTLATTGLAGRAMTDVWREVDTVATIAFLLAVGLVRRDFTLQPLRWLAPVGAVSYGLYAIAAPLQLSQRALFPDFAGSALTYGGRLVVVVVMVAAATWLLERRICPPLSKWIRQRGGPSPH
jgi:peptidoglycan/LPS O-acetylase OafA/YrhL